MPGGREDHVARMTRHLDDARGLLGQRIVDDDGGIGRDGDEVAV